MTTRASQQFPRLLSFVGGEMTKKVYKLGDKVRIRVADADKMLKTVDFELVSNVWDDEQ